MSFAAILFDCDGVLVDSEPIRLEILRKMLADLGWQLSPSECKRFFLGKSSKEEVQLIENHLNIKLDHEWHQAFTLRRNQALRQHVIATPGIYECLKALRKSWPLHIACVSAAEKSKMTLQLDKLGLTDFFDGYIFSGTQVLRNKPYPDVYLAAAQALGVDPTQCAVIEDSITGITAGASSGATVFAYCPDDEDPAPLLEAGAQYFFRDMRLLPDILQRNTSSNA
ncbi:HAD family hydrolase [Paenalcaligenes hominis]|uniref:HAD family hydrolase n=1 Tax=Paenalcaligenes hominis TaxID=643674 RepID=UPI0035252051